jgi:RimJ/RimL family protein N-acetyltransferase
MSAEAVRILQPGDEEMLEEFLLPRVEFSMFLIGNMRASGLVDSGQAYTGTYSAAFQGGEIISVAAHYWNGNVVLQAPVHLDQVLRVALQASRRQLTGLIGPDEQVRAGKDTLQLGELPVQMDEVEKLYGLELAELIVPPILGSGQVSGRRIGPADVDLVTRWRVAYAIEALGDADRPALREQCRASVERLLREGRTWVLEDGGRAVACSSFNTAIREAVQIGGVWTPPELRRRAYGRAVVAASLLDAQREGVQKAILFTGQDNTPAQRAYEALGFRHIGSYRLLVLQESWTFG